MERSLGERIKKIRKARKLTQSQLAKLACVDFKYISRIETSNAEPSLAVLKSIAKALEVEIKDLFDTNQTKTKKELDGEIIKNLKWLDIKETRVILALIKYFSLM